MRTIESRVRKVAYGKPKELKGVGKLINWGSDIGVRIRQGLYVRPGLAAYRRGRK